MPKLTALQVEKLSKPGRYADGDGLYLHLDAAGNKSWLFRFQLQGKRTQLGLGRFDKKTNSLSDARKTLLEMKRLVAQGINPKEDKQRQAEKKAKLAIDEKVALQKSEMTFERCATEWYERKKPEWKNSKHTDQVLNTLTRYAFPVFGDKPVADVSLDDLRMCLDPIWQIKTETASRVRQRVEGVLSYAKAVGYRAGANPAVWRGNLDQLYPKPDQLKRLKHMREGTSEHFSALHYDELPNFYSRLEHQKGLGAVALRFCILTCTRTHSTLEAKWEEVDLEKKVWIIPPDHKKGWGEFRVALPDLAVELLSGIKPISNYIFPGRKRGKPLSNGAMLSLLKRMGFNGIATVHGFRSTFRDYIGEATQLDPIVAEHCLAHQVGNATERAYARGDMLDKRFDMLNIWADYVQSGVEEDVTPGATTF
jgi:integrase